MKKTSCPASRRSFGRTTPQRWLLGILFSLSVLLAPGWASAQEESSTEPYFTVSSRQTYAPGQQPKVWIEFRQVDKLDFRVYRVKDEFKFFGQLRDAHNFGGQKQELAREKTLLERFHEWRRDLRTRIRNFFRYQLSYDTRSHYSRARQATQTRKRIPLDLTAYAQVPLLNREQVVLTWRELLPKTRDSEFLEIPVEVNKKGLYLVEVTHQELRAYTILMVTEVALVSKTAPGQILLFAANRSSGIPVSGATAVIYNNHQEIARGITDSAGVYHTTFADLKIEDAIMVAKVGDDVAATTLESYFFFDTSATDYVGYIYTDRPVYRPTHEVNFKGIVRARRGGKYSHEVEGPILVVINDAAGKTVYEQRLPLSSFGSFHGRLALPPLAALGTYEMTARLGEKTVYGSFEVEEYKKPEFEVSVSTDQARYLQGNNVTATVAARYYFGEPVAKGRVKYSIYKSPYYFPYWKVLWGSDEPDDEGMGWYDSYGYEVKRGTGQLDSEGRLQIVLPTEMDREKKDYRYRIEARVTDASNREISGSRTVTVTYSTLAVMVYTERYVFSSGEKAEILVRTVDHDLQPVSAKVRLQFEEREGWGLTGKVRPLGEDWVTTDAKGAAKYTYTVPKVMRLSILGTVTDPNGREASDSASCWISGAEPAQSEATLYRRVEIFPDKRSYKPGETARLLIVTQEPGAQVLVTTEGLQVYTWAVHQAEGKSLTVEIPVEDRHVPNFYVAATFLKNERLYEGSKSLSVPPTEKVLRIAVETDKAQYRPNDKVTYTITARDEKGRPVSAELSLGVVDEAIYAIRPDAVRPPEKVFYGKVWNRVNTQFSTDYWFTGYSGKNKLELTDLRSPTRLADFKGGGQPVEPKVRKYFPDTIYWLPTVVTDASGRARASFTWPDSLTTWRATVRAVTRDTLVGQVTHKVITRKDIILRLEIPRFFTQGDSVTVTGIVHNYLGQEKTATVSLATEGVELVSDASTMVTVPRDGEAVVKWQVQVSKIGQAKFLAKALTDEESDALELTVPIRPWGLQLSSARSGSLAAEKADLAERITLPADINADATTLRIDLAPSVAGALMSALDFLATFPYGCTEQTMSSFLPNILLTQAAKELGLEPFGKSLELEKKIAAGLQRLYQFQHEDGGWGWWETDPTHPFMTAYVVAGLAQAKAAGYPIDNYRLDRGRRSLNQLIRENPRALVDIRAYLVYALGLSGELDRALVDGLYEQRKRLSPHGQALLALTLAPLADAASQERAQELVRGLSRTAQTQGPYAWWQSARKEMLDFSYDNSFETTAYVVKALSRLDPQNALLPRAVRWLIDNRSDGYYWYSTEQTATALYGLIDYLKVSGELKPDYKLSVIVNGKKAAERQITEKDVANPLPIVVTINAPDVHPGVNEIRLTKSGKGVLYWSAFASFFTRESKPAPVGGTALNVVRQYFKLSPEKVDDRIVHNELPLEGPLQSGDVVVVWLTVSATSDENYLQIEDPIPAGFEFIEQEASYELKNKPRWGDYYYLRREFRDDRAALFSTKFRRGQGRFHYLLKAVSPGSYQVNPARVLPMYEPARQASTRSLTVTVHPR